MTYTPWELDVQFAPTFSPLNLPTSGDWVSLGGPFAFTIDRGRQDDLDSFEAGTMDVTLDNADESLDQLLSTSDIYDTDALPFTPVRLTATKGAETIVLFTGYTLDGFAPSGLRGGGTVQVKVIDWLGWAESVASQDSQWGAWCGYAQPTVWMRCQAKRIYSNYDDNPAGVIYNAAAIYTGAGYDFDPDATYPSYVYKVDEGIVTGSDKPSLYLGDFPGGTDFGGMIVNTSLTQVGRWLACGWFKCKDVQTLTWAGSDWSVAINGSGYVVATIDVGGSSESDTVAVDHTDEVVHMWVLSVTSTGGTRTMKIQTDLGSDNHSFGAAAVSGGGYLNFRGINWSQTVVGDFVYFDGANLDDLFLIGGFDGLSPAAWVPATSNPILWVNDTYTERYAHVCGSVGVTGPELSTRLASGLDFYAYQPAGTLAADIREMGDAFLGAAYMLRDGRLRMRDAGFAAPASTSVVHDYDFSLVEARISDESATDEWTATITDTFTRADNANLGGDWNFGVVSGAFGIISNAAYVVDDSTAVPMHYYQSLGRDVTVTCDFSNEVEGQGVLVRRRDENTYISVAVGSGTVNVTAHIDGAADAVIGDTGADAMGSSLTVTVNEDVLTVQIDAGTVHTFTITDPELLPGTGVGIVYTDLGVLPANTARWDNFSAECTRPLIRATTRSRTGTRVDRVYNAISVETDGSTLVYTQDADSIARYGFRPKKFTSIGYGTDELETYADAVLAAKKDPAIEVGDLTIRPWGDQYLTDWAMRDLELERAVQYREALYRAGTEVLDATYRVTGEKWDFAEGVDWTITLKIVPA